LAHSRTQAARPRTLLSCARCRWHAGPSGSDSAPRALGQQLTGRWAPLSIRSSSPKNQRVVNGFHRLLRGSSPCGAIAGPWAPGYKTQPPSYLAVPRELGTRRGLHLWRLPDRREARERRERWRPPHLTSHLRGRTVFGEGP